MRSSSTVLPRTGRRALTALIGCVAAVALAACGGTGTTDTSGSPASGSAAPAAAGAFPVTVEHLYGTTEITEAPKRVVALGYSDPDALLAVGVVPVGIVNWFTVPPKDGKWAWEQAAYGSAVPEVVAERDEYNMEKIAALKPDLIVASYSGMTKEQYDALSKIAKVVAQPTGYDPFSAPWQVMTAQITKAVGQEKKGAELVAQVEKKIADAKAAHPNWAGQTAVTGAFGGGQYFTFGSADPKTALLEQLGFTVPAEINQLTPQGGQLSNERLDLLNVDKLLLLASSDADIADLKTRPEYAALPVAQQNRVIFLIAGEQTTDLAAAFSYNSVLSLPFVVDELVPELEAMPAKS